MTEIFEDHYRTLQVRHDASPEVVEAAYRRLCKLYHPDVNRSGHAAERMKTINRAYEVLGDMPRRARYDDAWVRAQAWKTPLAENQGHQDEAQALLESYFQDLMDGRWDSAYLKLTAADHRRVPAEDFRAWQAQVSRLYRMGAFALKCFRRHRDCELDGAAYSDVREFHVFVNEIDTRTGRLCEDNFTKHVALDSGDWRVCLGFDDLKPVIERLGYLLDHAAAVDADRVYNEAILRHDAPTGLLSRAGFLEAVEREAVRSRRYGNPFTVAVFQLRKAREGAQQGEALPALVQAANLMAAHTRSTDVAARWGDTSLAALFIETTESGALMVCGKLARLMADVGAKVSWGLAAFDGFSAEDTALAAENQAQHNARAGFARGR